MSKNYKNFKLRNILGGVFHNFWPEEYGTWHNAIDDAFERNSLPALKQVRTELEVLLKEPYSEKELRKIITRELSANYYPPGDNLSYREWLNKILALNVDWIKKKERTR